MVAQHPYTLQVTTGQVPPPRDKILHVEARLLRGVGAKDQAIKPSWGKIALPRPNIHSGRQC